jgi:EAL domain-containing protein (putative c-di-GMP-specific phosphodiesterase class I)
MNQRKRAKWIPLVVAAVISVAPLIGLNALLWLHINANESQQVEEAAAAILAQVDLKLDSAMTALIGLGVDNVRTCGQGERERMARAGAMTPFTREIAIVDADGSVLCSHTGRPRVLRSISPRHETLHPQVTLDLVDHGSDNSPAHLRLSWAFDDGRSIRLVVPGSELIPPIIVGKLQSDFLTQLMLADGTLLSGRLTSPDIKAGAAAPHVFESNRTSERYPLLVQISVPASALLQTYKDLFIYGNAGGLVMASIVMLLAWLATRRIDGPEREIVDAIRKGQFIAYYQPVLDISNGQLIGCEALVRWRKPDGTIVPPSAFIGLAEKTGQIYGITRAVLRRGRDDLEKAYINRPQLKVSFNLVAGHFASFDIINDILAVFETSHIRMNQLVFEVTEREELPNMARARVVIARLQEIGTQVALDDVGTGHGGLSYLLKLGVDQMKIDKMFVDAIGTDRYSTAIIDSMVRLASEMSMDLVAEGVETQEQVDYLRAKGVRAAQGYIFAPPLPAKAYVALVEAMCPVDQTAATHIAASDAA